ncbi:hypothetical protein Tamer19_70510 [Cupriavidus sp. TA19]|uniref:hypothetical protein n=1 Tax=unclassified Cupriavidus TaxID=2640874 RepID=UPI000EEA1B3C|nr:MULTISPECIES: hypothetical protein [unclassified Cupriavidus]BDB24139.1 hypothetical protein CTP10_R14870 [Cupriavidus sp. P-10]GLC97642.1 hypothetical protein Tamer19_70510 [Cupriavidus sp. TA19]
MPTNKRWQVPWQKIARLRELGGNPAPTSPGQFRAFIQQESVKFGRIVEDARISPDS